MVQVPGQHSIMYAANADGVLACSTEHKDGCQMVQRLNPKLWDFSSRTMGYFLADDGRKYIYSAGRVNTTSVQPRLEYQAFWFSA
jgi:hypothetical protein